MSSHEDFGSTDRQTVHIETDRPLVTRDSDHDALAAQLRVKKKSKTKTKEITGMGPQPINRLVHRMPSLGVGFDSESHEGEESALPVLDVESDVGQSMSQRSP